MGKSKKPDVLTLILFGVLAVSVILVIVGVCIDWTSTTVKASGILGGGSTTGNVTLSGWADLNDKYKSLDGYGVMAAFAYITLALVILTAIAYVASKFVNVSVLKWVVAGLAALTVISAVVSIITTFTFCGNYEENIGIGSATTSPAAGAWLVAVFGMLGGGAGITGSLRK